MRFRATNEQMHQIMAAAANASIPVGLGFLHFGPSQQIKPDDFEVSDATRTAIIDYHGGRMVKFSAIRVGPDAWESSDTISHEYQSWAQRYNDYTHLVSSVIGSNAILEETK